MRQVCLSELELFRIAEVKWGAEIIAAGRLAPDGFYFSLDQVAVLFKEVFYRERFRKRCEPLNINSVIWGHPPNSLDAEVRPGVLDKVF